jgi:hypothetical protein
MLLLLLLHHLPMLLLMLLMLLLLLLLVLLLLLLLMLLLLLLLHLKVLLLLLLLLLRLVCVHCRLVSVRRRAQSISVRVLHARREVAHQTSRCNFPAVVLHSLEHVTSHICNQREWCNMRVIN